MDSLILLGTVGVLFILLIGWAVREQTERRMWEEEAQLWREAVRHRHSVPEETSGGGTGLLLLLVLFVGLVLNMTI